MLQEQILKARIISCVYFAVAAALCFTLYTDYRNGYYDLLAGPALLIPALVAATIYTSINRDTLKQAHLDKAMLFIAGIVMLYHAQHRSEWIAYWAYVIPLCAYYLLPFKQANIFSISLLSLFCLVSFNSPYPPSLDAVFNFTLVSTAAACYNYYYDYQESSLENLSVTDLLTNTYNKHYMQQNLWQEVARAHATSQPLSLLAINLDHFKQINELHGRPTGDQLLTSICKSLKNMTRTGDLLYRYSGEHFLLLLPNTSKDGALVIGERIRRNIELGTWDAVDLVTASLGSATLNTKEATEQLIERANGALKRAKAGGRNQLALD